MAWSEQGQAHDTFGIAAHTEEGCTDAGAMQVEANVQAVLGDGNVSFEIEAARLTLMRGDRGLSATTD
jgi:hypothetical protein